VIPSIFYLKVDILSLEAKWVVGVFCLWSSTFDIGAVILPPGAGFKRYSFYYVT